MKRFIFLIINLVVKISLYSCDLYSSLEFNDDGIAIIQIDVQYEGQAMDYFYHDNTDVGDKIRAASNNDPDTSLIFKYKGQYHIITIANNIPAEKYIDNEYGQPMRIKLCFYKDLVFKRYSNRYDIYGLIIEIKNLPKNSEIKDNE